MKIKTKTPKEKEVNWICGNCHKPIQESMIKWIKDDAIKVQTDEHEEGIRLATRTGYKEGCKDMIKEIREWLINFRVIITGNDCYSLKKFDKKFPEGK